MDYVDYVVTAIAVPFIVYLIIKTIKEQKQ